MIGIGIFFYQNVYDGYLLTYATTQNFFLNGDDSYLLTYILIPNWDE